MAESSSVLTPCNVPDTDSDGSVDEDEHYTDYICRKSTQTFKSEMKRREGREYRIKRALRETVPK